MKGLCLGMVATGEFPGGQVGVGTQVKGVRSGWGGPEQTNLSQVVSVRRACSWVHPGRLGGLLGRGYLLPGTHVHVNGGQEVGRGEWRNLGRCHSSIQFTPGASTARLRLALLGSRGTRLSRGG